MYNTTQLYRLFPRPKLCTKRFTHNVRVYDHILFLMHGLNGPSHRERVTWQGNWTLLPHLLGARGQSVIDDGGAGAWLRQSRVQWCPGSTLRRLYKDVWPAPDPVTKRASHSRYTLVLFPTPTYTRPTISPAIGMDKLKTTQCFRSIWPHIPVGG